MVTQLLRLKSAPSPADAADGVAIALTHLLLRGGAARASRAAPAGAGTAAQRALLGRGERK
jgi:crossover junction endodeoxyribonuclease RuvC